MDFLSKVIGFVGWLRFSNGDLCEAVHEAKRRGQKPASYGKTQKIERRFQDQDQVPGSAHPVPSPGFLMFACMHSNRLDYLAEVKAVTMFPSVGRRNNH